MRGNKDPPRGLNPPLRLIIASALIPVILPLDPHAWTPLLLQQVYSMDTGSEAITCVCFHPYHPVVCLADNRGFIKVMNYYDSTLANAFHVSSGESRQRAALEASG